MVEFLLLILIASTYLAPDMRVDFRWTIGGCFVGLAGMWLFTRVL